ncbi:PAS domain-containing hybrid sensor histidine kinase/response regulator [Marinicauda salina]|nr:PAS domain-containing hybrid sensor histidine kinase/response regulator [Marinicauda salina]
MRIERSRLVEAQRIAKIGSWELDFASEELRWSDEVFRIFEVDPAFVAPSYDRFLALIHPDDRADVDAAFRRSLETRKPYRISHRLVMSDGRIKWVEEQCETTFDAEGAPVISRGTVQDVTEARLAQEALRRSEQTLSSILRASPEAIVIAEEDGRIRIFSDGAEAIFRRPRAEAVGEPLTALAAPQSRAVVRTLLDAGAPQATETALASSRREILARRATGDTFPAEISVSRVASEEGLVFTAIVRDLSERKAYEAALQGAKARAEAASDAKSAFLATMSHEIRTPMNGVLGMLSLLVGSDLDDKQRRMAEIALDSGRALMSILNDVLDYSKIEAGGLSIDIAEFDTRDVLRKVHSLHRLRAEEKALDFRLEIADDLPRWLLGDEGRIQQILHNLVGNAVKFTERGAVVLRARTEAANAPPDGFVLEVEDTGPGMSEAEIDRAFERFSQSDSSTTRRYEGAGLGLTIVRGLVDAMKGDIAVRSAPGEGSCFTVTLPLPAPPRSRDADRSIAAAPEPGAALGRLRVLIAEDDGPSAETLGLLLAEQDISARLAQNGREAVACFEPGRFDLVLMDIRMPEIDGETALRFMREREREADAAPTPIIACTAYAGDDLTARYLDAGFDAVLPKPVEAEALRSALSEARERKSA